MPPVSPVSRPHAAPDYRDNAELGVPGVAIETSRFNDVNPRIYFTDLPTRLVNGWPQKCIDELMPWHWTPQPMSRLAEKPKGGGASLTFDACT